MNCFSKLVYYSFIFFNLSNALKELISLPMIACKLFISLTENLYLLYLLESNGRKQVKNRNSFWKRTC